MPPARANISQESWPNAFPLEVRPIISAIVGGAPFARSLTPLPTGRTGVTFPLITDVDDPAWGKELSEIPQLLAESGEYDVAVSRLSGSILISQESIDDADWPVSAQTTQIIEDTFSSKLDRDFIGGAGPHPTPTGILAVASEVTGADWELAAIKAKAEIATAGGAASHIALTPAVIGDLESARDEIGRSLYPDASTAFAGLETVTAVAASQPVVYDWTRLWMALTGTSWPR